MILPIMKYGQPVLRKKGVRIEKITPEIQEFIENMLETMYAARGVGLAAQQVGSAVQIAVVDVAGVEDRPSTMEISGEPVDVDANMPLVLINPKVTPQGSEIEGPEGCLSFPEIYGDIARPERVSVTATDQHGKEYGFTATGLLARAVQHELDHLNGILFIDRMTSDSKEEIKPQLERLQALTRASLEGR